MDKTNIENVPLLIENSYSDFFEFIEKEKYQICYKILELFEEMINNGFEKKLLVTATVQEITFHTEYNINIENLNLLTVINNYFENTEEYEICARIQKLIV